jgi:hypothetical protein
MEFETRKVIEAADLGLNRNATAQELVLEFVRFAEAQVLRWIQFPRGILLFLGVPGDESSGWFYVLDRRRATFFSIDLPCDGRWGGFRASESESLAYEYGLLRLAESPRVLEYRATRKPVLTGSPRPVI